MNDLLALDLLLRTASVSESALALGLTQSALSRCLARLRTQFEDPLLVRVGRHMELTPRAEALLKSLSPALDTLERLCAERGEFEPRRLEQHFRLVMPDYILKLALGPMLRELAREAPRASLDIQDSRGADINAVRDGSVSVWLGILDGASTALRRVPLFKQRFVGLARRDHPILKDGLVSLEAFVQAQHALIAPRGLPGGPVDRRLTELGHVRHVSALVASFSGIIPLVESSDAISVVPETLAAMHLKHHHLETFELPFDVPGFTLSAYWSERVHDDRANMWLRELLFEIIRQKQAHLYVPIPDDLTGPVATELGLT